jgi:hypothetical protein
MPERIPAIRRTEKFMKYAASSCGMPIELHGKQETMRKGAKISLELPQPYTMSAFCRAKIPPIEVEIARICIMHDDQAVADTESPGVDRVFEGRATKSLHHVIKEGDTVIGMASTGCSVLVVNADDPEVMDYLHQTYDDKRCMQYVSL